MSEHRGAMTAEGELYPSPPRALDYLDVQPPEPGHARQIGERLWWARIPLPMELNHINVWLMDDGDQGWTLVDTGMAEEVCREAWGTLATQYLGGKRLHRIFITHDHPDHMGLSPWLAQQHGAALWMSPFAHASVEAYLATPAEVLYQRSFQHIEAHGMAMPPAAERRNTRDDTWFKGVPPLAQGCADGDVLTGAGRSWRMIETDGHCRGHLCLHDAAGAVLISGDQVLPTISPNVSVLASRPEGNPLDDFLTTLEKLAASCPEHTLVLPSHGKPFRGLHRRIEVVRTHHLQKLEALREACIEPRTAFECLPVMYGRVLRGFHRLLAMGETLAHLHYLWHAQRVQRELGADGVYRFAAI